MFVIDKLFFCLQEWNSDFVLGQEQETMDLAAGRLEANLHTI